MENAIHAVLRVPPVLRCLILRDLGLLTWGARGRLYELGDCWNVLSGAEAGLQGIVRLDGDAGSKRDRNERALRRLWTPYLESRNPALAALLPKPHPPTLQHQCCEKRKLDLRKRQFIFPGARDARVHRSGLCTYWSLIAPHARALLTSDERSADLLNSDDNTADLAPAPLSAAIASRPAKGGPPSKDARGPLLRCVC